MKKMKTVVLALVIGILIWGGYRYYQKRQAATEQKEEAVAITEDEMAPKCEAGEWVEFPDYSGAGNLEKYEESLKLKKDDKDRFLKEDGSVYFTTSEDYSLIYYMDREVRIEGVKTGKMDGKEVYVKKIKCVGEEADQELRMTREKLMDYVAKNINSLAPEKNAKSPWEVQTFYFVNKTDLYVQYESKASLNEESPYDSRLWLVRAAKMNRDVPVIETLAYIQEDAEDPEKNVVKQGKDIYSDVQNMTIYEFDGNAKRWVLAD